MCVFFFKQWFLAAITESEQKKRAFWTDMPSLVLLCIWVGLNPGAAQTACAPQTRHPTMLGMHWNTQCWPYLDIFIGWIILIGKSESHDLKWQLLSSVLCSMCSSEVTCLGWVLLSGRAFQECSFFASSEHILSRHPRHYPPSPAAAQAVRPYSTERGSISSAKAGRRAGALGRGSLGEAGHLEGRVLGL